VRVEVVVDTGAISTQEEYLKLSMILEIMVISLRKMERFTEKMYAK